MTDPKMSTSRRTFLKQGAVASSATFGTLMAPGAAQAVVPVLINTATIPQFVSLLPNPLNPVSLARPDLIGGSSYTIAIKETTQDLGLSIATRLKPSLKTVVWNYASGALGAPIFPGPTFEIQQNATVTVSYVNKLTTAAGAPLPNRMPVDLSLDWANPGAVGGLTPVPLVAHLHGGGSATLSDGEPDAWSTPGDAVKGRLFSKPYVYENRQEAGHLWYHDHTLGITRTNAYMGLAGNYFIRDANENFLRNANVLPRFPYEVPLMIADKMFDANGGLYYPSDPLAVGMPAPSHLPEFFGDVITVNGKAWPKLNVEPRKYRFRVLNASDARFYELKLTPPAGVAVPAMYVIGNELGLLNAPTVPNVDGTAATAGVLRLAPGERYDLIVDFTGLPVGTRVVLSNSANAPYPGGGPVVAGLTDRVMAFDVVALNTRVANATVAPGTALRRLIPTLAAPVVPAGTPRRRILLVEGTDKFGRLQTMLGTVDAVVNAAGATVQGTFTFKDAITEQPKLGTTEIWEFYNTTVDAHPMHMHLVDFRVLDREAFSAAALTPKTNTDGSLGGVLDPASIVLAGAPRSAPAWEAGRKDTVVAFAGEVTRVLVTFSRAGEYVYHCHILSHEDHEMMRSYKVI